MPELKFNRIKEILRGQGRTNRWVAAQLGKTELTISRWCRNVQQPKLETLYKLAELLDVDVCDFLIKKEKE